MQERAKIARRPLVIGGITAIVLTLGLGLLVSVREVDWLDEEWMEEILELRGPVGESISRVFDFLGGGWFAILVVPIGVGIAFVFARRPWSALDFVLASAFAALLCQLLKVLFGRARPEEILLPLENGSFPSGHTTNAAVVAVSLGLLLQRTWVWVVGMLYIVAMAISRTYLGAHWITDTVGGALLGAGVALLVWCVMQPKLRLEPLGSPAP